MASKIVRYVFEVPVDGIEEAAFTVGTVNLGELGEHAKLRHMYQTHFEVEAGVLGVKPTPEQLDNIDPALLALNGMWARWARIKTSLRMIMVRYTDSTDLIEAELSDLGWDDLVGISSIPIDLFDALDTAAVQCNPRVFGAYIPEEVDSKNARTVGVISVT